MSQFQSTRRLRRSTHSEEKGEEGGNAAAGGMPDFNKLKRCTLKRYADHYGINLPPKVKRDELVKIITEHFKTIPVNEFEVVGNFTHKVKSEQEAVYGTNSNEGSTEVD